MVGDVGGRVGEEAGIARENRSSESPERARGDEPTGPGNRGAETREHLANERTLLAWVRTGVGLISVGFVVERAGALAGGGSVAPSEFFGVALVALGCLALIVGSVEFFANRRMIRENEFVSRPAPYMILVGGSLLVALTFVVYVLV